MDVLSLAFTHGCETLYLQNIRGAGTRTEGRMLEALGQVNLEPTLPLSI